MHLLSSPVPASKPIISIERSLSTDTADALNGLAFDLETTESRTDTLIRLSQEELAARNPLPAVGSLIPLTRTDLIVSADCLARKLGHLTDAIDRLEALVRKALESDETSVHRNALAMTIGMTLAMRDTIQDR